MNLADPELELIDPTPNVHSLFVHFDSVFFWTKLANRALVRWSKRMYSCAGICSYEGRNGICDIALSEPLLKLRPRKDLVETLLHEMIHAFLFITNRDNDRDGHGPNFKAHMNRINAAAGLNISIYHDFHDEVKVYLKHVWRCTGPCRQMRPFFGVVRRSMNRAPGPSDYWWKDHKKKCSGQFIKTSEPEKPVKKAKTKSTNTNMNITKYINNNDTTINLNNNKKLPKDDSEVIKTPLTQPTKPVRRSSSVIEKVRDVWLNKQLPTVANAVTKPTATNKPGTKHKPTDHIESPSKKIKKIDDYFKATSILKDLYGDNIKIEQSSDSDKLKMVQVNTAISNTQDFVDCPSCNNKININDINRHLDECLNTDLIEKLTKDTIEAVPSTSKVNDRKSMNSFDNTDRKTSIIPVPYSSQNTSNNGQLKDVVGVIPDIPPFKFRDNIKVDKRTSIKTYETVESNNHTLVTPKIEREDTRFNGNIKSQPSTSKSDFNKICPCCGCKVDKPIEEHLDECLVFFNNDAATPEEGNLTIETIVIDDDDDQFDESQTFNETGTKSPCPCCLKMVEVAEMNEHLDICLST